mmetsp:Transcript_5612/g.10628  ORF Transcript_5612/g.10628 Transcript_5612/m.10628 type:complete len:84 (+) Transcript_5612:10-261(+)
MTVSHYASLLPIIFLSFPLLFSSYPSLHSDLAAAPDDGVGDYARDTRGDGRTASLPRRAIKRVFLESSVLETLSEVSLEDLEL